MLTTYFFFQFSLLYFYIYHENGSRMLPGCCCVSTGLLLVKVESSAGFRPRKWQMKNISLNFLKALKDRKIIGTYNKLIKFLNTVVQIVRNRTAVTDW